MALRGLESGLMSGPGIILTTEVRDRVDGRLFLRGDSGCRRVVFGVRGSLMCASVGRSGVEVVFSRGRGRESCS